MFIWSMKMKKKRLALALIAVALIICATVWFVTSKPTQETPKASSPSDTLTVQNSAEIAAYIRTFGWEIEEPPCETLEVKVPKKFNDVYTQYNDIQKKQGFDLEPIQGKTITRTTFVVTNYPNYPENIRADVLTLKNKIVAADICSLEIEGFIHALNESR